MNTIWFDGFEHYYDQDTSSATNMDEGLWSEIIGIGIQTEIVRTGNYAMNFPLGGFGGQMRRTLSGNLSQPGCTFGMYMSSLPIQNDGQSIFAQFRDSSNFSHVGIKVGTTGRVIAMLGGQAAAPDDGQGTVLGQSTLEVAPGTFNHFEVKVKLHASAGFVKVMVNGTSFLSLTGINTIGPGTTEDTAAQVAFGWFGIGDEELDFQDTAQIIIDDVVAISWLNDGTEDTDFLGMKGIYYQVPNSNTGMASWVPSQGDSGYPMIDEIQPDDDATYIFSTTTGNKSGFGVAELPTSVESVVAVMPIARMKKTDSGVCSVSLGVLSGSTENDASAQPLTEDYSWSFDVWQTDPNTGEAWSPTDLPVIIVERTA